MDIEEAKQKLRDIYEGYGFEERPFADGELCFFNKGRDHPTFTIDREEIQEYSEVLDQIGSVKIGPVETCILGNYMREQSVELSDPYRGRFFGLGDRERVIRFGDEEGGGPYVEIGAPSPVFRNFYRDKGKEFPYFQERLVRRIGMARINSPNGVFRGMLTARVVNLADEWTEKLLKISEEMIESCLFDLAYLKGITLELKSNWPLSFAERRKDRPFQPRERTDGETFPLKPLRYDGNVTKFYQRAVSSDDTYVAFVSFYHILEYYFISVADAKLYTRLERIVNDPVFSARQRQLDRIISSVDEHSRENDETEMLKGVIAEFVEEDDVIDFIQRYETYLGLKIYTEKMSCFGYELDKMQIKSGHIFGPISKRIKTIRNALVHSSDRYERRERYVPGEEASRILTRELPLLRFLAEKVIIATAKPSPP